MSRIIAIDPGTEQSAYVVLQAGEPLTWAIVPNDALLRMVRTELAETIIAVEQIESFGMAVGREVFETVKLTGRIQEIVSHASHCDLVWIPRRKVKLHLCGNMKAKDPNIRQALIDRYGGTAETKKGGKLYKLASHCWAALAVGVVAYDELSAKAGAA